MLPTNLASNVFKQNLFETDTHKRAFDIKNTDVYPLCFVLIEQNNSLSNN